MLKSARRMREHIFFDWLCVHVTALPAMESDEFRVSTELRHGADRLHFT
jgi:hypothetical protein